MDGSEWNYDLTLYPKNETGNPTLEKTVRESKADTGENAGKTDDITDGYNHTATASDGDVVEYQVISTLPTITSPATALTTYTFVDNLSKGIQYNKGDVKIEFFKDAACTDQVAIWMEQDGKFTTSYTDYSSESGSQMTITMTESGLSEINAATTVYDPADTLTDDCHVYTYGLDLTKKFSDNNGNFDNVKFLLKNATDNYYVQAELNKSEGVYYVTGHTEKEADATKFSPMSGEVNHSKVLVKGLEDDSYVITEVATDSGYTLLKENITVDIVSSDSATICSVCGKALKTATAKVNGKDVAMNEDNSSVSALVPLNVTNTRGFDLPKTGGKGNALIYGLGIVALLTAGGITAFYLRKRRHG